MPDAAFDYMKRFKNLFLGSNAFIGTAPSVSSVELEQLDISDNAFAGNLLDEYFSLPSLKLFSASVNCLSLQLSLFLCNSSTSLSEIYLNGLQQSSQCNKNVIKSKNKKTANLPSCTWSLTSLTKLYVSGNGYNGKITNFSLTNIIEFDVSSNRLYGKLPAILNNRSMQYFDASSNHFSGTLQDVAIQPLNLQSSTFNANINRLSGPVPQNSLKAFFNVNVLSGNVISCGTLPPDDPNFHFYSCGSSDLEYALYFWLCSLFVAFSMLCVLYHFSPDSFHRWRKEISGNSLMGSDTNKSMFPRSVLYLYSLGRLHYITSGLVTFIVVSALILYCPMKFGDKANNDTYYTYQYQYRISGAFQWPYPCVLRDDLSLNRSQYTPCCILSCIYQILEYYSFE